MKNYMRYILIFGLLFCSACFDDQVVLVKPGEPIEAVSNLDYAINGGNVLLSWELPSNYPNDIIQPVSVQIKITADGRSEATQIIENAPEDYTYASFDPSVEYRFTVKVMANVDTSDPHVSNLRYSLGQTVAIQ